ncbi:MAG: cytochrome c oxidase subunit 3 [Myxococcota bacterium]
MKVEVRSLEDPPGGVLLWLIVTLELVTFAMVFGLIAYQRASSAQAFAEGQQALSLQVGLALTLILVTSGALAAQGVHRFREGKLAPARRWFLGASGVGALFVVLKLVDSAKHVGEGHRLGSSDFWDAYYLGTGFHFLHVLVGLGLLLGVASRVGRAKFSDEETAIVGSALFWHMCDVAWFFLFPLFFAR